MATGNYRVPKPKNEPVRTYEVGSKDREELKKAINELKNQHMDIPLIIGGQKIYKDQKVNCTSPHDHQQIIGQYSVADKADVQLAIKSALEAKDAWEALPYKHRAGVFLKAAELIAGKYRYKMNAATMLCQSKSAHQSEIDSVCELIDFLRFNAYFLEQIYDEQPNATSDTWNRVEYTGLDGFVYAVSPFNFTAIGGNLACAPAIVGNVVVWKPGSTAVYSNYMIMEILVEAGLPAGVINFIPGKSSEITDEILSHPEFSGFHYTGSTSVFSSIWKDIGNKLTTYKSYPRIVGETGGKNFVFAHEACDVEALSVALVRGAFEYQGQKCSAASRAYIPSTIWDKVRSQLETHIQSIKVGSVEDFTNFMNAVIDERAFDKISNYIEDVKLSEDADVIIGGNHSKEKGYFIDPTVVLSKTIDSKTMIEEIFGPVLTIYVYDPADFEATLENCANSSMYALTGAIFAQDRHLINHMEEVLKKAAGNFYINDKPTGAVVGQQPFGGARASGTNDKAGSKLNLFKWINTRLSKENMTPVYDYTYPFMKE